MTSLLILSFSPIASDARVLKQVAEFAGDHDVTTCGYGPPPPHVREHIRIPDDVRANDLNGRLITLRLYRQAYRSISAVAWTREALSGRAFDVILANDIETLPIALELAPRGGVHADLHEYSPLLHEENPAWKRRISPYVSWLCRRHLSRASSWSTVSGGLAREYGRRFGIRPEIVTNAAPYVEAEPTPVHDPIRLVHSGACLRNRALDVMVRGVMAASANVTLDLYLTPNDGSYLEELRRLAAESEGRVRVQDPVPYARLAETLRAHDVGVHVLAPVNFNNRWALPNKLFDYVQARLGVIVGPSPEMVDYVRRYGLGAVTADFTAAGLARTVEELTAADVAGYKAASHRQAHELSAQEQVRIWRGAIARLDEKAHP